MNFSGRSEDISLKGPKKSPKCFAKRPLVFMPGTGCPCNARRLCHETRKSNLRSLDLPGYTQVQP